MSDAFGWVDKREEEIKEERAEGYFDIKEGAQQFILLTHCAPLSQVFDGKKYRPAVEGDTGISIRGVCWVLSEGVVKQAKLPYTVVKAIRALQQNPDWEFKLPFPHNLTLTAVGAGTKEVKYTLTPSPKEVTIPAETLAELSKKPTPEEVVEKIKGGGASPRQSAAEDTRQAPTPIEYPKDDINPEDIPF